MNWIRIVLFTLVLVLLPNIVGFVFGVTNGLWQETLSPDAALWLRRIVIVVLVLLTYLALAVKQQESRLAHLAAVFIASEIASTVLHLGIGGPIRSAVAWIGVNAIAAAAAYLCAEFLSSRGGQAA